MFSNGNVTDGDIVWIDYDNNNRWGHTMVITGWYWNNSHQKHIPLLNYHSVIRNDINHWQRDIDFIKIKDKYPSANFVANRINSVI